jgi:effector-binding domain-containing protein
MLIRKKKFLLSITAIIIYGLIVWGLASTIEVKKKVDITADFVTVSEIMTRVKNIPQWYSPFAGKDTTEITIKLSSEKIISFNNYSLQIEQQTPFNLIVKTIGANNKAQRFTFLLSADTTNDELSLVELTYTTTTFKKWFSKNELEENAEKSLINLKSYLEDNKKLYGFAIERETVSDTTFVLGRRTISVGQKRETLKNLYEELEKYALINNLDFNGTRIFNSYKNSPTEITLLAGIGINKPMTIHTDGAFEYKKMPLGGKLLSAIYQGPLSDVQKVYDALEKYRSDHHLTAMAIPFIKFLNDGYDYADDQIVQLKAYYPVF